MTYDGIPMTMPLCWTPQVVKSLVDSASKAGLPADLLTDTHDLSGLRRWSRDAADEAGLTYPHESSSVWGLRVITGGEPGTMSVRDRSGSVLTHSLLGGPPHLGHVGNCRECVVRSVMES